MGRHQGSGVLQASLMERRDVSRDGVLQKGGATSIYLASSPAVAGISGKYFYDSRVIPTARWLASLVESPSILRLAGANDGPRVGELTRGFAVD